MLARPAIYFAGRKLTREAGRLGSTAARLKLKGIDGEAHNQWSMWFNSIRSDEPYLGLKCICKPSETEAAFEGDTQLLHGCRQLVT